MYQNLRYLRSIRVPIKTSLALYTSAGIATGQCFHFVYRYQVEITLIVCFKAEAATANSRAAP